MYYTEPDSLIPEIVNIVSFINSVLHRLKGRSIRKLLLVTGCLVLVGNSMIGQVIGDYRSVSAGNWSTLINWQRFDGTVWATPTPGQGYPGEISSPGRIDINNDITLNLNPANPIGNLFINTGTLELSSYNFTVNGITNISSTLSDNNETGYVVFNGQITVSNTATWTTIGIYSDHLLFYGNIVNNSNNVSIERARASANIVLSGTGTMIMDYFEFNNGPYTVTNQTTLTIKTALNENMMSKGF